MRNIQKIIEANGGLIAGNAIEIAADGFMPLNIEVLAVWPNGAAEISVAHYGEQNGDAMRDPDITFWVLPRSWEKDWYFHPTSYRNDYLGIDQQAAEVENGAITKHWPKRVKDINVFCRTWNKNIKDQGFLDVIQAQAEKVEVVA